MNISELLANLDKQLYELEKENNNTDNLPNYKQMLEKYKLTGEVQYLKKYVSEISYGSNIDLTQALLENVNGYPILKDIIRNKIFLSMSLRNVVFNNEELMNIIFEEKNTDIFSLATEKDFLTIVGDKTILEHLVINNMFKSYWVKEIKNSDIILDIILKYNLKDYFSNLDENQLFKVYKGKLVIEFMFEHKLVTSSTISNITKHPQIYDYIIKYNKLGLLAYIEEELQTQKINDKYIFDLIIENNQTPRIYQLESEELINLIIERKRYELLRNLPVNKLKEPYLEYDSMFEFLIVNGITPINGINEIKYDRENMKFFYDIIEKNNMFKLLSDVNESSLLRSYNEKETLLETLLSNGIVPTLGQYNKKESLEILYEANQFEELQKCDSTLQKEILPNGKMLCEELLDRNLDPGTNKLEDVEIIKKIFERKRYDLYTKLNIEALFKLANLNETFMDLLLEESKVVDEINISEIANKYYKVKDKARVYIAFAKHDLQMYLKKLSKENLLEDNLLNELMMLDKELTINKIVSPRVKEDVDFALMIKFAGMTQDKIKFKSVTKALSEEYLLENIEEYESLQLTQEQESLLNALNTVMNDGKSDPDIFRAFLASYRHLLAINSPHAYEIYHLINIKQNNSEFSYAKTDDGAYFSFYKGAIFMDDTNIDTLNHETGHALFRYLTNEEIPPEFNIVMDRLRTDESFLQKTAEYSKKLQLIKEEVKETVERDYMPIYDESITEEKKQEIQEYLNSLITEQKQMYLKKGYPEETLDLIFNKTFTLEEYLKQDRRVKKSEMIDLILRTKYGSFLAIGDYLDGIHVGKLNGGILKDKDGNKITGTYGHGIYYYSRGNEWAFNEMLANYSATAKSKNGKQELETLKEYIGEELFNIIQNYYYQEILQSKQYMNETTQIM